MGVSNHVQSQWNEHLSSGFSQQTLFFCAPATSRWRAICQRGHPDGAMPDAWGVNMLEEVAS